MRHHSSQAYLGLKTATRLIIHDLGGIDAAAAASRVGRSQFSDYTQPGSDRFIPVDVLLDVEALADAPHVTAALARTLGYELTPVMPRDRGQLGEALARLSLEVGELFATASRAFSDGRLTDEEREQMAKDIDDVVRVGNEARALLRRDIG